VKQEVLFFERQYMMTWVLVVVLLGGLGIPLIMAFVKGVPPIVAFMTLVFIVILLLFASMQTKVTREKLLVSFGLLPLIKFSYRIDDVRAFEVRSYQPVGEYGGWGIKGSKQNRALNMRGSEGVQLELLDKQGSMWKLLIGSQMPEKLASALRTAKSQ
jgi:hypothetical protein